MVKTCPFLNLWGREIYISPDFTNETLSQKLFQGREVLTNARHYDPLKVHLCFLNIFIENILADNELCFTIHELMIHFDPRIDRTDGRHGSPGLQGPTVRNDILRAVQK